MEKKLITEQLLQIEELTATVTRLNKIAHAAYAKIDELEKIITKLNQASIASAKKSNAKIDELEKEVETLNEATYNLQSDKDERDWEMENEAEKERWEMEQNEEAKYADEEEARRNREKNSLYNSKSKIGGIEANFLEDMYNDIHNDMQEFGSDDFI
jgi:hypothetical protein